MNNTQNKEKIEFNNLKEVQNLLRTNALGGLSMSTKKARSRIEQYISQLKEKSSSFAAAVKVEEPKIVVTPKPEIKEEKKAIDPEKLQKIQAEKEAANRAKEARIAENMNRSKIRNFENNPDRFSGQNKNDRPRQGGFSGNQQRDFRNSQGQGRPNAGGFRNAQGQKPNGQFQGKPAGQRPVGPRPAPQPTLDVSELAKNNNHAKKKVFVKDKPADEKKSMNKKALVMRGYVEDDESVYDENVVVARKKSGKKVKSLKTLFIY